MPLTRVSGPKKKVSSLRRFQNLLNSRGGLGRQALEGHPTRLLGSPTRDRKMREGPGAADGWSCVLCGEDTSRPAARRHPARRTSLSEGARPAAGTGPTVTLTGVARGTAGRPGSEAPGHSGAQDGARGAPTRSPARPSDLIRSGLLRLGTGG